MPCWQGSKQPGNTPILTIISGISGAGKTVVLNTLSDLGYYCIDTLPVCLLNPFLDVLNGDHRPAFRVAAGVDARNAPKDLQSLPASLQAADRNIATELIFLDAEQNVLIRRFSETGRRHPMTTPLLGLSEALCMEREALDVIAEHADMCIDTSNMDPNTLRRSVQERIAREEHTKILLQFVSFAFKRGVPRDADFVFDVRCLPNPYWDQSLRGLTGRSPAVIDFFAHQKSVQTLYEEIRKILESWIPRFTDCNRRHLCIAIGCTGGQHRSVYIADRLVTHFSQGNWSVLIRDRELPDAI